MNKVSQNCKTSRMTYFLVVLGFLSNIAAIVFGILNSVQFKGLFHNNIANLSAKYYNEVTPDGIVFMIIWPIIYLWTFAANIYLVVSLCLPAYQSPVKFVPSLTPQTFLVSCIVGPLTSVVWLFSFDREMVKVSFAVLVLGAFALWDALVVSLVVVYNNLSKLENQSKVMLLVMRILVHNGLALFATWSTVATVISFANALIYVGSSGSDTAKLTGWFSVEDGSSVALGVLFVIVVGLFVVENFSHEKYFRYVFTIFPVFVIAFSGLVAQLSSVGSQRNLVIASTELGISILCLLIRIALSVYRLMPSKSDYYPTKISIKSDLLADY